MRQENMALDDCFEFGKCQAEMLEDVMNDEPSYIVWALDNEVISLDDDAREEAERLKII